MTEFTVKPFLKWAGGKSQLLPKIFENLPQRLKDGKIKKYVEPFLGGGAVFFYLSSIYSFEEIILNDINCECILTYKVVQQYVDDLIEILSEIENEYINKNDDERQEMFYKRRSMFNEEKVKIDYNNFSDMWISHAANMIFLNKTCFNGLYRQNRKGQFNVPFGKYKNPTICDLENLKCVNKALHGVKLTCSDFEILTSYIDENTFVYMDPPYRSLSNTSNFTDYSKEPFNDESQKRLASWFHYLDSIGASLMLSNSDPTNSNPDDYFFDNLYEGYRIERVNAIRAINSNGNGRGTIRELLILNNK